MNEIKTDIVPYKNHWMVRAWYALKIDGKDVGLQMEVKNKNTLERAKKLLIDDLKKNYAPIQS